MASDFTLQQILELSADERIRLLGAIQASLETKEGELSLPDWQHVVREREKAEEEHRRIAQRLASTLESITDGFVILDRAWNFTALNAEAERLMRIGREQLLGRNLWECFPEAKATTFETELVRALAEEVTVNFQEFYPPYGQWFEVRAYPSEEGLAIYFRDVTALRVADEALRASEERFRLLARATNDAIWDWDVATGLVWRNEGFERLFGNGSGSSLPPNYEAWAHRLHPEDHDRIVATIRELMEGDSITFSNEYRLARANGEYAYVLDRGQIIRNETGQAIRLIGGITDLTPSKLAEEKLRRNEAILTHAQQIARLGHWEWNVETDEVFWSPQVFELFGVNPSDFGGNTESFLRHVHPEDREATHRAVQKALEELTDYRVEYRILRGASETRFMLEQGEVSRHKNGRPQHVTGTVQDITDRKEFERALAESNRALQLLSRANEALIRSENESALLQQICRIAVEFGGFRLAWVGYAQEDLCKTIVPQAFAGEENGYLSQIRLTWGEGQPTSQGPSARAIRTGKAVVLPDLAADPGFAPWLEAAHKNGLHSIVALPLKDEKRTFGVLVLYLAVARVPQPEELALWQELADDLAFGIGHIRAQRQQLEADAHIREQAALLDKAHDAIIVSDTTYRINYWNKAAERIYGWSAAEAQGKHLRELLLVEAFKFEEADDAIRKNAVWEGEIQKTAKNGTVLTVEGSWTLMQNAAGVPTSILIIETDITARRKLEHQFLRAQRMESIGTLAGGIAHDLNNVLGPILMSLELLKMKFSDPSSLSLISILEASANHGAGMVRQVLSFARGVEGQKVEVQVKHLIRDIEKIANETFLKNIQVRTIIPNDLWTVIGDPTQLHQVLLNLCVNARDAMHKGGLLVISAENRLLEANHEDFNIEAKIGPHVMIMLEDSGVGMPDELVEKIFDPFFTTKEFGHGTGLGLSTTLAIVKSHGGFIRVASKVGYGSQFRIYLPAEPGPENTLTLLSENNLPRGNGELILVIDDEASVREITQQILETFGYRVLLAADGADATVLYTSQKEEIAVVFTDMMMPMMDGVTTIHVLKRINPRVKIIAASGLNDDAMSAKAAAAGVTQFIAKPYTAETLLKGLKKLIRSEDPL